MDSKVRINLSGVQLLLVDSDPTGMQILEQIFSGFGVRDARRCRRAQDAIELLSTEETNLLVVNDQLEDMSGYDLVKWLRHSGITPNSSTPAIIVSGHTKREMIAAARDCGANFIVAKPLSPMKLMERVIWVSKESRPFVETGDYAGPDRRSRPDEPRMGGRRRTDPQASDSTEAPRDGEEPLAAERRAS
jgi:DNA-binding response OmpR family regulator